MSAEFVVTALDSGDRGMDGPRDPCDGFGDETVEERTRGGTEVIAALRMPLHAKNKVSGRAFGGLAAFDGFDDGILWTAGGDAEAVAGNADGLMVARVDGKAEKVVLFGSFGRSKDGSEKGFGCDGGSVGDGDLASSGVVDGKNSKVLNQRAAAPYVEYLDTEADGEDGFVEVVRVLEEEFVDILTKVVGRGTLGDGVLTVLMGVHVGRAAGEEDGLTGIDKPDRLDRRGVERNFDGLAATAPDS
jgi:hypothetical protein